MEDYKRMWFQLKKQLLMPPSMINKETILRDMARIEIREFVSELDQVVMPIENKCSGKFFKR